MANEILTSQTSLDRIFKKMRGRYSDSNRKQQEFAVKESERTRAELCDLLAEYDDGEGVIARRRARRLIDDLDSTEKAMITNGEKALHNIIEESTEFTTGNIAKIAGVSITASQFDRINKHVVKYVINRFAEYVLVLSERIWVALC